MNRKQSVHGFTLLELLLSMALIIVLLGILWNVVTLFQRTQTRGTRLVEHSQLVRSLAQLLEDDFTAAVQDPIHPFQAEVGDDDIRRFGLNGSSQTLRVDVIAFNPFITTELTPQQGVFGEIDMAGSQAAPKTTEFKTVFYDFRLENGLSRREIDYETPDIDAPGPEGSSLLAPEVVSCHFRYYDGSSWRDSWDSISQNGLPVAIEATLEWVSLSEAKQIRDRIADGEDLQQAVANLEIATPPASRFVVYLPTSPVQKHEEYRRTTPPPQENLLPETSPPPSTPPPPVEPTVTGPQQSWIRGG